MVSFFDSVLYSYLSMEAVVMARQVCIAAFCEMYIVSYLPMTQDERG